jgi:hypothetical protein
MHKLNKAQARAFVLLHPEVFRVLYAMEYGHLTEREAAGLLIFDDETFVNVADAAQEIAGDLYARARAALTEAAR